MYTYKRAVGVNIALPRGMEILNISTVPVKTLLTLYRSLTLVVTDGLVNQDVSINASDYANEWASYTGTIQAWLNTKSTVVLKTSNTLPGTEYRFATYHDIQYEWFSLYPGDARLTMDRQVMLSIHDAPDMRVHKTDNTAVDYKALSTRALYTINNHFVRAVATDDDLYLLGAGKHYNVNDNFHVGCINLNTLSTLNTYPVLGSQIDYQDTGGARTLRLDSPVSLKDKTVWMSIGGRLYFDDVIQVNGDKGITVRVERVDWFNKLFDSKGFIDLSNVIAKDREVVPADFFKTESFFKALLTDVSTFFIVLDNPNLYVSVEPITTYRYPFTFHTEETKRLPLMLSNGLLAKYFTRKIINRRLLDIDVGVLKNYMVKQTGVNNEGNVLHGYTNRFKPSTLFNGYLLYIRALLQEG